MVQLGSPTLSSAFARLVPRGPVAEPAEPSAASAAGAASARRVGLATAAGIHPVFHSNLENAIYICIHI